MKTMTFEDYKQALIDASPSSRELLLDKAAEDVNISFSQHCELVGLVDLLGSTD